MTDNYWECMGLDKSPSEDCKEQRKEAYKRAHEIRKFEIELFWKRGTYYWAFILAAFTAHFALLSSLFNAERYPFSLCNVYSLPRLSLLALIITSLFCYFFSLCWVLMNKGSKFWQENWEKQIYALETEFSGSLYRTMLNTENKDDFCACTWSLKPYNYSVTKITALTSIVLAIASCFMNLFYVVIFALRLCKISSTVCFTKISVVHWICLIGAILAWLLIVVAVPCLTEGNKKKEQLKLLSCLRISVCRILACLTKGNKTEQQQVNKWRNI